MTRNCRSCLGPLAVVLLLSAGCERLQQARTAYADLAAVRRAVQPLVGSSPVEVRMSNGTTLAVRVVNRPMQALPAVQRQAKARELAAIAYDAYAARRALSGVRVDFLARGGFPLLTLCVSVSHGFDPRALHGPASTVTPRT